MFFSAIQRSLKVGEFFLLACVAFILCAGACRSEHSMLVTVTAYNSIPSQTNSKPTIAAWGDRIKPGMKAVAVSRDLVGEGLTHGTKLRIEGLEGEYVVLDKTHRRFRRRVDVYMGVDVKKAKEFGIREARITWRE